MREFDERVYVVEGVKERFKSESIALDDAENIIQEPEVDKWFDCGAGKGYSLPDGEKDVC